MSTAVAAQQETPQVVQLGKLMELVGEVADVARIEIADPPEPIGVGQPGTWTRITGFAARIEAQATVYERIGGPPLPAAVGQFAREARTLPTRPKRLVGEAEGLLAMLTTFTQNADFSGAP
jgi:hypothetical protein